MANQESLRKTARNASGSAATKFQPGPKNPRWNERLQSTDGYKLVRVPPDHPRAWSRRHPYAYEHIILMEQRLGRPLQAGECVHHINGNKQDNRPENLTIVNRHQHGKHHMAERKRDSKGRLLPMKDTP